MNTWKQNHLNYMLLVSPNGRLAWGILFVLVNKFYLNENAFTLNQLAYLLKPKIYQCILGSTLHF